jgi:hypothetical protein
VKIAVFRKGRASPKGIWLAGYPQMFAIRNEMENSWILRK